VRSTSNVILVSQFQLSYPSLCDIWEDLTKHIPSAFLYSFGLLIAHPCDMPGTFLAVQLPVYRRYYVGIPKIIGDFFYGDSLAETTTMMVD
jgi:hypothetical protein